LAESVGDGLVREKGEELLGVFGSAPWVLAFEDVFGKVLLEDIKTPTARSG
jgi:hypothetical protein